MARILAFPKTNPTSRRPDVEFVGGSGFFCVYGQTEAGVRFLNQNVDYRVSEGTPEAGIAIQDNRLAFDIANAALNEGCLVRVNGEEL
jgi:hypothetical protein